MCFHYNIFSLARNVELNGRFHEIFLRSVMKNKPYLLALLGQLLFGFINYGRKADMLYYLTYV